MVLTWFYHCLQLRTLGWGSGAYCWHSCLECEQSRNAQRFKVYHTSSKLTCFPNLLPFLCSLSHWFSSPHLLSCLCPLKNSLPFPLHYLWLLHDCPKNIAKIHLQNSHSCLQYLVPKNIHFIIWETRSHLKSLNCKVEKKFLYFEAIVSIQCKGYEWERENTWVLAHVRRIKQKMWGSGNRGWPGTE